MSASPAIDQLRRQLAAIERKGALGGPEPFSLGLAGLDAELGGGLARGAMHEVFADGEGHAPAAGAVGLAFALRAAGSKPILWVRQDFAAVETGGLYAPGLKALGLDPRRLVLVRARDGPGVLRAAEEAARCSALGAVVAEPWGAPKALDLVASRRLALAAESSRLAVIMIRAGASPAPSAAATRWLIRAAPSTPLEADAPGHPAFAIALARARAGPSGRTWIVEWDRAAQSFAEQRGGGGAALHGAVAAAPAGGPHPARAGEAHGPDFAAQGRDAG